MQAAVMKDDQRPVYGRFAEPQAIDGAIVVEVLAAALTGLDKVVARRVHYVKMPDGPFVLGREGVARRSDGRRIYFNLNAPVAPFGSMAERTLIDPQCAFAVPDGVADDTAAALGNAGLAAWLGLSWRGRMRPGETVLILGATGVSGLIAVNPEGGKISRASAAAPLEAGSANMFNQMGLAGMAGQGMAGPPVAGDTQQGGKPVTHARPSGRAAVAAADGDGQASPAPRTVVTGVAAAIREIARQRDEGRLSEQEYTEQKKRLLEVSIRHRPLA